VFGPCGPRTGNSGPLAGRSAFGDFRNLV